MTDNRKRLISLIFIMVIVSFISLFFTSLALYKTELRQERERLKGTAQSQARLIESMARYNIAIQGELPPEAGAPRERTLSQIIEDLNTYKGFGNTEEIVLAEREGDDIVFLFSYRSNGIGEVDAIPYDSPLAEPMKQALSGQSGDMVGLDYRGETVLAAFEPVDVLKMGIVVKIDLSEVREPYVRAVSMALGLTMLLVVLGAVMFIRITGPMIKRLERSEEKYRTILESIEDGYYEMDLAHRITFCNNVLCRIQGYSRDELVGIDFKDYMDQETVGRVMESFNEVLSKGAPLGGIEYESLKKDGTIIHVESSVSLIRDHKGTPIGFRGIVRDRTERKHMETQLLLSQKLEAVGRLAGGVAHDFNNLMTVVIGNSDLILMSLDKNDPLRKDIKEIKKAGDRAATLTRQLLAFSRKQALRPQVMDLNTVLTDMDKMLKQVIGEDVELRIICAQGLGRVKADISQIEQVVMNLAINARDAMPDGGKLTIETANVDLDEGYTHKRFMVKTGAYVMLTVSDTGSGMDEEVRENIFEPFFTTKEKGKGTGLGLSMVYGIIKQSNGYVWVYSEPNQGSTFKIYLPRVMEEAEAVEKDTGQKELQRGSETILLVEDNDMLCDFAAKVLRENGYTVLESRNGKEALDTSARHQGHIQLLLTDVVMPGMNGRELAKRLMSLRPEIKVMYMSGYTDNAIVHHGVLEEGVFFLQKPFTTNLLLIKVREVLGDD